jgi:hypothetical protein
LSERSAARRNPMVRNCTSLASAFGPTSSASVPLAVRRCTSIWNSRSFAWSQPCRNSASRSLYAYTCQTPSLSRCARARCSSCGRVIDWFVGPSACAVAALRTARTASVMDRFMILPSRVCCSRLVADDAARVA